MLKTISQNKYLRTGLIVISLVSLSAAVIFMNPDETNSQLNVIGLGDQEQIKGLDWLKATANAKVDEEPQVFPPEKRSGDGIPGIDFISPARIEISADFASNLVKTNDYQQFKGRVLDAIKGNKRLNAMELKEFQSEAEKKYADGFLNIIDFEYVSVILLGLYYQEDSPSFRRDIQALNAKIQNMKQEYASVSARPDPEFIEYKRKEQLIIQQANSMEYFPSGVTKAEYIEAKIKELKRMPD